MQITIDKEFQSIVPGLHADELKLLKQSILNEGCRDALVVWGTTLIDGHNRFDICTKHNIPFSTRDKHFTDRQDAINWIIGNQLGRRNLTPDLKKYLLGKMYNEAKKGQGGDRRSEEVKKSSGQNDHLKNPLILNETESDKTAKSQDDKTASSIAREQKVGEKTVRRAGPYAKALDIIGETLGQNFKDDIVNRVIKIPEKDVIRISGLTKDLMTEIILEYHTDNNPKKGNGHGTTKKTTTKAHTTKKGQESRKKTKMPEPELLTKSELKGIEKVQKEIDRLGESVALKDAILNYVLPHIARKYPEIDKQLRVTKYSSTVLQLTHERNAKSRELVQQQKLLLSLREENDKLKQDAKTKRSECKTLCKGTNERMHDHYIEKLKYSIDTIKQHLIAYRYMQTAADKEIVEQLTMNDFFNFLTIMRVITMSHLFTEKVAQLLGIYKGLLQLDECKNINALPRLKQRLNELDKEFRDKGLSKAITHGMTDKTKLKLVPDQHMEKRLMSLHLIDKTAYLKEKADNYQIQMQSLN
jgi:hypothetical protein